MQVTTIGLDIAKNVFQVHAIDTAEKVVVRKQLRRSQVPAFFERALLHSTSRWVFRCSNCARYNLQRDLSTETHRLVVAAKERTAGSMDELDHSFGGSALSAVLSCR